MPASDAPRPALARAGLDRAAGDRESAGLLDAARRDRRTRVLAVRGDLAPLAGPDALHYVAPEEVPADTQWAFLGRESEGAAVLVAAVPDEAGEPFAAPAGWASLRATGAGLSAIDAGVFVEAVSIGRWLLDAAFCPACGTRTDVERAGWSRRCPGCGREHFPRTDPAVIVAITSATDPDLLLLGANAAWGGERFSCFAGFVEAGESLEATIAREMQEEAGVDISEVRYRGSQAWPYPRSLMLGFTVTARDDAAARPDGEEIIAVRWFHRDEIADALAGRGDVGLPGPSSIAHRLISDWLADRG